MAENDGFFRRQMSDSLVTAAFVVLSGGFQDAYTYCCRGKVFANAQTGNIVLMSANLLSGEAAHSVKYIVPLLSFLLGIMAGPDVAENVVLGLQILFALPCLLLVIRRLHDIGRSGWWWLLVFIPFVNFIMGIYLMCKKGETGPNRFGPDPLQ